MGEVSKGVFYIDNSPSKLGLKVKACILRRVSLQESGITFLCCTSGGASPTSSARFLFFTWSSTGCFPLFFGGERERLGDSSRERAGASQTLGVKLVVRGAKGIVDWPLAYFGATRGHAPFDGPTAVSTSQVSKRNDPCSLK